MDPRTNYAIMLRAAKKPPRSSAPSSLELLRDRFGPPVSDLFAEPQIARLDEAGIRQSLDEAGNLMFEGTMGGRAGKLKLPKGKKAPVEDHFDPEGRGKFSRSDAQEVPPGEEKPAALFDLSRDTLEKVPGVEQRPIERYKGKGPTARIIDLIADQDVRDQVISAIEEGVTKGGKGWYNTEQLREAFQSELGKSKGAEAYSRYMDLVAATSPRSKLPENVKNASYYYHRSTGGNEGPGVWMPKKGEKPPEGYGHLAQSLHNQNARTVLGEGWDPMKNPKPPSYAENLRGNQLPVTVDAHAIKLPAMLSQDPRFLMGSMSVPKPGVKGEFITINPAKMHARGELSVEDAKAPFWESQPRPTEYGPMERYYQDIGDELGMTGAQTQASAWVGGGERTGLGSNSNKSFLEFLSDQIHHTAQKRGVDPQQILRDFIRGKIPLLSTAGAAITIDQLTDEQKQQLGVPSAPPPGDDWAAGLKEGEAY